MSRILDGLRRDHAHVGRLLRIAERELNVLEQGRSADYGLLEDIMRYITGYSDAHHHRVEDVLYDELERSSPDAAKRVEAVVSEHGPLIEQGRSFLETIEAVEEEAIVRRDQFIAMGRAYVSALGRHMGVEESELFPLAEKSLTDDDWRQLNERTDTPPDPLFGESVDTEFRQLWARLQAHGA